MISDIYFDDNYGKLYEDIEKGSAIIFNFENQYGKIKHQFIKRKIPIYINDNIYYDIITPYGYGGPIILECVPGKQKDLIEGFYKDFKIFCNNNFIVSEFIRFHPIFNNAQLFNDIYDVCFDRKTLGTNLKNFDDPIKAEFSKSCRKNIRQALNKGVGYRIIKAPEDVSTFKDIYYSTMDRNKAKSFYYFNDDYFNKALHYFKNNIVLVEALFGGKTIAAGFYFIYDKIIHMHLSGTLNEYLYLSPAYILRYAITKWGKENGYELIHHGGGKTNSNEDTLFQFKKKFSKNTEFSFFIGKKIWNKEIYDKLCKMENITQDINFFPAYRFEEYNKKDDILIRK